MKYILRHLSKQLYKSWGVPLGVGRRGWRARSSWLMVGIQLQLGNHSPDNEANWVSMQRFGVSVIYWRVFNYYHVLIVDIQFDISLILIVNLLAKFSNLTCIFCLTLCLQISSLSLNMLWFHQQWVPTSKHVSTFVFWECWDPLVQDQISQSRYCKTFIVKHLGSSALLKPLIYRSGSLGSS